ncbi:MAG: ion channel [Pseudomonadota bacterium]
MANDKVRKLKPTGMTLRGGAFVLRGRDARKLDWRDPYHLALAMSWPRFVATFLAAELSLNFIFASLYLAQPGSVTNVRPGSLSDAFFFSLETLATVGYGVMAPATLYGHIVASTEIFAGMTFMTIMTGLVFVRFSRPRARIIYAENAVVGRFNGQRTLMIRIGNGRAHAMAETKAVLSVIINEWSGEGQFFRRIYDLPLMRARIPIFGLTWTLMHRIDETSPLYPYNAENFSKFVMRLFLSIEARDPMLSAHVYDNKDYDPSEILFGHRYADAVATDEQGRTIADLSRVGWTEPEAPAGLPD